MAFSVYISDAIQGQHAALMPPRLVPAPTTTEAQALALAFAALQAGSRVWKIRRPDGSEMLRHEIESLFRARTH